MDRGTDIARRSPRTHAEHLVRWAGVPREGGATESGALRAVGLDSDGSGGEMITVTAGGSRRPVPTANSRTPTRRRGDRLGIGAPHRFGNIAEVGNTAAASIPLALADTAARDLVRPGERSLLTAFGGGLTWGSLALSWIRRRYPVRTDRSRDTRMPLESIGRIG